MQCSAEAWLLRAGPAGAAWQRLPDHPLGHYHHTLVGHEGQVVSFGGHLCSDGKAPAGGPFYYTNAVFALNVSAWLPEGCDGRQAVSGGGERQPQWRQQGANGKEL